MQYQTGRREKIEMKTLTGLNTSEIRKFLRSCEYIRGSLGADAPVSYISGLMYLALRDSMGDPVEVLGLVRKVEDKFDQRKKYVELTQKGKYFIEGLVDAITGEETIRHA